jgi:hypothetical protein
MLRSTKFFHADSAFYVGLNALNYFGDLFYRGRSEYQFNYNIQLTGAV